MSESDLVVCRAGAGACAEVTAVGLPAILVPGTFGGAHQERNARDMVAAGAAVRIADDELTPETLLEVVDGLDPERLRAMAEASRALGRPDAALAVVRLLEEAAA
jgi:UDP-N-acetylglucosamine--N-acetylmuramyl-(pentapeptide) pyrophosphoryl-undecaprenol N-acetylglucosamine transferase